MALSGDVLQEVLPIVMRHETGLTSRELEVMVLVAQGKTNGKIAASLGVAESTVKSHLTKIYHKLGVRTRGEAGAWAWRQELLTDMVSCSSSPPCSWEAFYWHLVFCCLPHSVCGVATCVTLSKSHPSAFTLHL